ncbi:MAG TPA: hypothetical protein VJU15_06845 [Gemmatimonadales bacterium]|nr:hypothetical protein [Gemmatimonadales bacterium]
MTAKLSALDREKLYTDFLRAEGYRPDPEMDGAVTFEKGERFFYMPVTEDPDFFIITLPMVGLAINDATGAACRRAMNQVTAESRVAKGCYNHETKEACINIELFCDPAEAFKSVFGRCIAELEAAHERFNKAMKEA